MKILNWDDKEKDIVKEIESYWSPLKIILKTKDEHELVNKWVDHHREILGASLIIFDNMSTDNKVKEDYVSLSNDANIYEFSGNHNLIHDARVFSSLYKSLEKSCKYYIFLDTDEFLLLTNGIDRYYNFEEFLNLELARDKDVFLGFWALNDGDNENILYFNDISNRFSSCLKGGKPMISSRISPDGFINHNVQLMEGNTDLAIGGGVIIAHYNMFYKERRIQVNKRKILAHGFMNTEAEIDTALSKGNFSEYTGNLKNYLTEAYACIEELKLQEYSNSGSIHKEGVILLEENKINIVGERSRDLMYSFVNNANYCWCEVVDE